MWSEAPHANMGAAESKGGDGEGLEDVQAQLNAIRAKESLLLQKMQVRHCTRRLPERAPGPVCRRRVLQFGCVDRQIYVCEAVCNADPASCLGVHCLRRGPPMK